MNNSEDFLREMRERRRNRERRDMWIGFAFLIGALVVSSVLWWGLR